MNVILLKNNKGGFFCVIAGMEIVPNGVILPIDANGKLTGEAFVRFIDRETADRALTKHMTAMGTRWGYETEVFRYKKISDIELGVWVGMEG